MLTICDSDWETIQVKQVELVAMVIALALVPMAASAQSGSEADQEACTPDVLKLCGDFIPNEAPIVACLRAKRLQLSPACGAVMFPVSAVEADPKVRRHRQYHH